MHHADATEESHDMYMVTSKQKKNLDPSLSEAFLFLHSISGCDTTSRPYGIGKVTVLLKYAALQKSTSIFMSPSSSKEDIKKAG